MASRHVKQCVRTILNSNALSSTTKIYIGNFQARCIGRRKYSTPSESIAVMHSECGDPKKVLYTQKVVLPSKLENSQILVKMKLAPINPSDINMIEGTYMIKPELPAVAGNEGCGEVIDVGSDVSNFKPGDWIMPAGTGFGTWREFAVTTSDKIQKIPNDVPALSAATVMVNPSTAYRMLKDFVCLHEGDVVIQNGSNSAVGQAVIQLAKEWNITTVNIVRNRPDIDDLTNYLKGLGATHVVTEEFCRTPQMKELIKSLPDAPKLAFNTVGGPSATELIRHLKDKGVMVTYGGMSRKPVIVPTGAFIFKRIKLTGFWNAKWTQENFENPERIKMLDELFDLMRESKLRPPACDFVSLDDFKGAVDTALDGFQNKKKVFVMDKDCV